MALTISTGFVVDDAIVVTENISRVHRARRPADRRRRSRGPKQIGFTIVSITVSLLAVFIPILLMGGIVGRLFREFAVTLSDRRRALGARVADADADDVLAAPAPAQVASVARLDKTRGGLRLGPAAATTARSAGCSGTSALMLLVTAGTIALTVYLFIIVPKGLFPQQDTGLIMGASEAPQDVSFPR